MGTINTIANNNLENVNTDDDLYLPTLPFFRSCQNYWSLLFRTNHSSSPKYLLLRNWLKLLEVGKYFIFQEFKMLCIFSLSSLDGVALLSCIETIMPL